MEHDIFKRVEHDIREGWQACAVADWVGYDETLGQAIAHTERQVRDGELTHLQPFDALAHRVDSGHPLPVPFGSRISRLGSHNEAEEDEDSPCLPAEQGGSHTPE